MGISLEVVLALVCAVTFFRAGRFKSTGEARDYSFSSASGWFAPFAIQSEK